MAGDRSPSSHTKNPVRLQDTVSRKTTPYRPIKPEQILRDPTFEGNGKRNKPDAGQWRTPSQLTQEGISLDHVFKEEKRWGKQTNLQPKISKHTRPRSTIQAIKSLPDTDSSKSQRLHDKTGHLTGLLPYPNSANSPQIPFPSLRRRNLRDVVPPVWPSKCPLCFCQNHKLARSLVQTNNRDKTGCILGRLLDIPSGPRYIKKTRSVRTSKAGRSRVASQQKEIFVGTLPMSRISRNNLEHRAEPKNALSHEGQASRGTITEISEKETVELARRENPIRKTELRGVCDPPRQTPLPTATDRFKQAEKIKPPQKNTHASNSTRRIAVVVRKHREKHGHSSPKADVICHHRCSGHGLGCYSKQPENGKSLGKTPTPLALQPERTMGSLRNSEAPGINFTKHNGNMANGQSDSSSLHNKTRWNKVEEIVKNGQTHSTSLRKIELQPDSSVHPRALQQLSGQPLQEQASARMAPETNHYESDFSTSGHPRNRSACLSSLCSSTEVCERRCDRHREPIHRCVQPRMALQTRLGVSPTGSDTESVTSSRDLNRALPAGNPRMAQSILDTGSKETGITQPMENSQPIATSSRPTDESSTCGSRQPKFAGLDGTGWANEISEWNSSEINLLQSSWRESTLRTYRPAWERWRKWTSKERISTNDPQPKDLARFLCHLYEVENLAPRTILLHKSVVATFANPQNSSILGSHPIVAHTIKGILAKNPIEKRTLTWKLDDLFQFLDTYNVDTNSLFSVSRHTATLLLLASGRRVHDLTLLSISPELFEDNNDEITLWPRFGSKTDSHSFRQSGWCLRSNTNSKFNIVQWIRQLIALSRPRRETRHLEGLFITTRGKIKDASRAVIAGWVKTLFKEANISSSAGSIRAGVATYNWTQKNLDIDEVLRRGNWRSKNTFFNHYFRLVKPPAPASSTMDLNNYFAPVD